MELDQALNALRQECDALRRENNALRQENNALRHQRLQEYLSNSVQDDRMSARVASQMDRFFPEPESDWYLCVLFYGTLFPDSYFPLEQPMVTIERHFAPVLSAFGKTFFFEVSGLVACLVNIAGTNMPPSQEFYQRLMQALAETHRKTKDETDASRIAVSRASRLEQGPRTIFHGAISASERRTPGESEVYLERESAALSQQDSRQMLALEQDFWRQIAQRDFYKAAEALDQLIHFSQEAPGRGTLERTLASVFSRMELVLSLTAGDGGLSAEDSSFQPLLGRLSRATSFQEMRDSAYDILAVLEDQVFTPENTRNRKMPGIERYIQANYMNQNLGANSIADVFRISPSYLSRIFKQDQGIGIVDYIHRVRVNAAKVLLGSGNLTMDQVAEQVGFTNRSALFRVFKKLEGTTPGAYRDALMLP